MIYLDNAATSFPKPHGLLDKTLQIYKEIGVSPGRGGYDLAIAANDAMDQVRCKVASFFGSSAPDRVVFQSNATDALNTLIMGACANGGHVVTTNLEHNSVLRPLHFLEQIGKITWSAIDFNNDGYIDPQDIKNAIKDDTILVICNHASNVIGTVQPIEAISEICSHRDIPFAVDMSQTAGVIPVNMKKIGITAIAFTGHKSLFAPTGIGGLLLADGYDIAITRFGGTGVESKSLIHTAEYPFRHEAGTHNLLGIIGLGQGIDYVANLMKNGLLEDKLALWRQLRDGLQNLDKITLYCANSNNNRVPVLSFSMQDISAEDLGIILDGDFEICCRTGLHCAPLVHKKLGTYDTGTVRFSLGAFTTKEDIQNTISAITTITS